MTRNIEYIKIITKNIEYIKIMTRNIEKKINELIELCILDILLDISNDYNIDYRKLLKYKK